MFKTHLAALFTTILAVAASACSATPARPVTAVGGLACQGGTVQTEEDAARFEGCETIVGDLRISRSDLSNVSAFSELRRVSGKLIVENNAKLISLCGLKNVEQARSVEIRNNRVLGAFPSLLPQLKHVDESVVLDANRALTKRQVSALVDRLEQQVTVNREASVASNAN